VRVQVENVIKSQLCDGLIIVNLGASSSTKGAAVALSPSLPFSLSLSSSLVLSPCPSLSSPAFALHSLHLRLPLSSVCLSLTHTLSLCKRDSVCGCRFKKKEYQLDTGWIIYSILWQAEI